MFTKVFDVRNLQSAIVLFLVALPLNLGVAVSSGVPIYFGIISGVVGSLIVGALSGAPLMVSGPDAGIGVLVLEMIQEEGIEKLGAIVLLAGFIQIIVGMCRGAIWFRVFSPAVVNGMLAGMGLIIILTQLQIMLDSAPLTTGVANALALPAVVLKALTPADGLSHHPAACIGLLTIFTALVWGRLPFKGLSMVPAPLVAILVASIANALLNLPIQHVSIPHNVVGTLKMPSIADLFKHITDGDIWLCAATVGFVASAQSLLTAAAIDSATQGRKANLDRELVAQGIGNMICGVLGSLPVAGVLLRSMANVQSGATSRSANLLHGAFIVAAILLIPGVLNRMPVCALAAMLVLIGVRMVRNIYGDVRDYARPELVILLSTVVAILFTNLFTGVLIGFGLAAAKELYTVAYLGIRLDVTEVPKRATLYLWGSATFLQLPKLASILESVPTDSELHVRLDALNYIDHACLELLMEWAKHHRTQGGDFSIDWGAIETRCRAGSLVKHRKSIPYFSAPDAV